MLRAEAVLSLSRCYMGLLSGRKSAPRRRKLRIASFRASAKSSFTSLLLLSPQSLTTSRGPHEMGFYRLTTRKTRKREEWKGGHASRTGKGLGYPERENFGNQLGLQPAPKSFVHAQMRASVFVVKLLGG